MQEQFRPLSAQMSVMLSWIERHASRTAVELAVVLTMVILVVGLVYHSGRPVTREEVSGSYRPEIPLFLNREITFSRIDLDIDGTITVTDLKGRSTTGRWWWDASEGLLHSDLSVLDARIYGHQGWTGKQLQWRCDPDNTEMVDLHPTDRP